MDVRRVRAGGAALVTLAALGLAASPALASGTYVADVSSLGSGATAGTLHGTVVNETAHAKTTQISVNLMRRGTKRTVVGRASVRVPARGSAAYGVKVKLPGKLARGMYYLAACTPSGNGAGKYGCATAQNEINIGAKAAPKPAATAAQAEDCSAGGRSLSAPGSRIYPDTGNTGYTSVHTDVFINYDAPSNLFLSGTHVDLQQRATKCLTEFSLDFVRNNTVTGSVPGPDFTVGSVEINGQPATFTFKQPTYPGDPNGDDDPDPAAHATGLNNPINADNPNPPACNPTGTSAALQNQPCPATKLVITPSAPIPSGTDYKVTVNYTGRPGVYLDPDGSTEGWFRNNNPVGDGGFVTTEPVGTMAWMPLNNHPTSKPTYDFYDTVNYDPAASTNRVAIGNGRLISTTVNAADTNFPTTGSRTFHWRSPEPIANYLVENSMGFYSLDERFAASNVIYYEAQAQGIAADRQITNKAVMDQQEDITLFQTQFNGPFPFSTDGVIVGIPSASFEEEMQTKITFAGGRISLGTFNHENMHQWWGDNVSEGAYNLTFLKEGYADLSEGLASARTAATNAGGMGTPAGDAAFETSLANRFNTSYNSTSTSYWGVAPSNPSSTNLFSNANTYSRPGRAYIALRAILGKNNFNLASQEIQRTYGGGWMDEARVQAIYQKYLPNQSPGCHNKLAVFFKQWWDTSYTGSPAAGNKPSITGPGLAGNDQFYDANGGCLPYGVDVPGSVGGDVGATLSLTLGAPATFGVFTPGVSRTYLASTTANVISTAGDAALSVTDPSTTAPGRLVNGTFALRLGLQAQATSPLGASAGFGSISGSPLSLLTYDGPVANDAVALQFRQSIGDTDPLRTGAYSKTLTFTLATTNP
ncbi:MAG TPA: hypothetical protein VNS09_24300 [Solirubrobacter sp.]|nr:hypothetical protein [Solirubrobacter sp.]